MPREAARDLWAIPGARECQAFFGPAKFHGRVPAPGWKASCRAEGYNYRFDAAKFWKQILIPEAASADMADGDILVWLDGDVETTGPVPLGLIPHLLGDGELVFLGRQPKHSEIGFWAVRINPATRYFLFCIANTYRTGAVLDLKEWHSAFVWDSVRRDLDLREVNLCPSGARGHVWPISPMGAYTRHDKGKRKPGGTA